MSDPHPDETALVAAETLAAAAIGGLATWYVGKQARAQADLATAQTAALASQAQLRDSRHKAAEDLRDLAALGAMLDRAITSSEEAPNDSQRRANLTDCSQQLASHVDFIWDVDLRRDMTIFLDRASSLAVVVRRDERASLALEAREAWAGARARSGLLWRALMFSSLDGRTLLLNEPSAQS